MSAPSCASQWAAIDVIGAAAMRYTPSYAVPKETGGKFYAKGKVPATNDKLGPYQAGLATFATCSGAVVGWNQPSLESSRASYDGLNAAKPFTSRENIAPRPAVGNDNGTYDTIGVAEETEKYCSCSSDWFM